MNARLILFFLTLSLFSGGCTAAGPASPTAPVQIVATNATSAASAQATAVDPTATNPQVPSTTPAPSATSTIVPTDTATTLPPTPTETPEIIAEFRFFGDVRQMPDANAAVLASFSQGIHLRAVHQDPSGQWLYVQIAPTTYGWVQASAAQGSGLTDLPQATAAVTATPEAQASTGLKCFLTVAYTDSGKPRMFQIFIQGLTPVNPYTMKLFNPKGGLLFGWDFKPRANGTLYKEYSADKATLGAYTLDILFAGATATSCSGNVVQK